MNSVLSTAWGGSYVNESVADARMLPQDLDKWSVRNSDNEMVSFASFATGRWTIGLPQLSRFDGTSTIQILGKCHVRNEFGHGHDHDGARRNDSRTGLQRRLERTLL